jgi:hypothetical protein
MTKRNRTKSTKNSPWHPPTFARHPNQKATPPYHLEYLQHSSKKGINQPNGKERQSIPIESRLTTEHDQKGEKGWILLVFSTVL